MALPWSGNTGSPTPWIDPPRLRVDPAESRHATWLELFFDLIFVVAVAQIATGLAHDHSAEGFVRFAAIFVPVAWAWVGFAVYANRFDTDDVVFRVMMALGMLAVGALAVNAPHATTTAASAFAISYVAVRTVLIGLYYRAYRHVDGQARDGAIRFVIGFGIGAAFWLASAFVDEPARYVLWALGFGCELATPLITWLALAGGIAPLHWEHIEERFGLFTIIVLGESVLAVVVGTDVTDFSVTASVVAAMTFAVAVAVWWIYFDFADTSVIRRGARGFLYIYGHMPLYAGLAAMGVGAKLAIKSAEAGGLDPGTRWALCGGLAAYLLCLALFHAAVRTSLRDSIVAWRAGGAIALVALAALGGGVPPIAIAGIALGIVVVELGVEATCTRIDCAAPVPEFEVSVRVDEAAEQPG